MITDRDDIQNKIVKWTLALVYHFESHRRTPLSKSENGLMLFAVVRPGVTAPAADLDTCLDLREVWKRTGCENT